ncbi:MAG: hypothetical protein ACLSAP_12460, partial [Oscillospiraceae bacterium]
KLVYSGAIPYWYFDGVDRQVRFTVSTDGYLEKITDHLWRETTFTYKLSGNVKYLDKITYPDGTHTHFGYSGSGLSVIRSCEDKDGACNELGRLTYTYDNTDAFRVNSVTEAVGSTVGQSMKIQYGNDNSTTFETSGKDDDIGTTADNMTVTYVFDNTGRVTSVYDRKGNAQSYDYYNKTRDLTANPTTAELNKSNKIIKEGVTGSYVHNLIKNPSAEASISDWGVVGWTSDKNYEAKQWGEPTYVYVGGSALRIDLNAANTKASFAQSVTLEANTPYTFSAYAKLYGIPKDSKGAFLCVEMVRSGGEKEMVYEYLDGPRDDSIDRGFRRMILNFRTPADLQSAKIHVGAGYVYTARRSSMRCSLNEVRWPIVSTWCRTETLHVLPATDRTTGTQATSTRTIEWIPAGCICGVELTQKNTLNSQSPFTCRRPILLCSAQKLKVTLFPYQETGDSE